MKCDNDADDYNDHGGYLRVIDVFLFMTDEW